MEQLVKQKASSAIWMELLPRKQILPGVKEFVEWLYRETNNSYS